jgi:CBS domain containing-hemolysin-like protein
VLIPILFLSIWFFQKHSVSRHHPTSDKKDESVPPSLQTSLAEEEQELIQHIKEFQDGIVREVMIPRIDIVAVEETTSLETFRQIALEKGHSRIPVYRETIDHVVGIAYVKDMLRYWNDDATQITVAKFMRPPYFIPDTKNIDALLHEFQAKKVHIAVAIDEYGGTAGIVTIEDLLEVVFGDIVDEHDEEEEELVNVVDDHTIEISAKADIDELEEYMGELVIESQDFETVGGLLVSILGEIPKPGDTVTYQHLKFTILDADKHRIVTVKVEYIPENVEIPLPP